MPGQTYALGEGFFTIDPRRTALIVIDMQNAFVAEDAPWDTSEARMMIPRLERIILFARDQGMPIIWTQSDHRPPYGGILLSKIPLVREKRVTWLGESSHEIYPHMLQPREDEHRVVKHKYDAFFETDLDAILRELDETLPS